MAQDTIEMDGDERGATQRYVREGDTSPSTAVTLAVTDVLDRDVDSLEPLAEVLDADALDALAESANGTLQVEFEYEDCLLTIRRGTEIFVTPTA